ncbi:hypothetical protein FN846DRAFT_906916 [Sphaerosporella brunnea]|uniref:Uncharacterized protein n=1 Tax=Sphaerosporella brunnea TaxID=1250544 RepID=A0A5J5EXI2_9PEZI|nr:hypothetical protein FN846DRAFT_906916 [Sphaerosporella brunnea]
MKRSRQSILDRLRRSLASSSSSSSSSTSSGSQKSNKRRSNAAAAAAPAEPDLQPIPERKKAMVARDAACRRLSPIALPASGNHRPLARHRRTASKPSAAGFPQQVPSLKSATATTTAAKWIRPATTIGIITAPGSPTSSEATTTTTAAAAAVLKKTHALVRVVEQQSMFISEQQTIILKLIEQMERMDLVLQRQRQMIFGTKPLPQTPPAQDKPAEEEEEGEVDETESVLDRIGEEIAGTYDALSCMEEEKEADVVRPLTLTPSSTSSFDGSSSSSTTTTTASSPSDWPKRLSPLPPRVLLKLCEEEPESPVLPRSFMGGLTPPMSPFVVPDPPESAAPGALVAGEWFHVGNGRFYRTPSRGKSGRLEGGYI